MLKKSLIAVAVFLIAASLACVVYFETNGLYSSDDPYYHAYRATALWQGVETPNIPLYSTIRSHPVNLYTLYHATLAPFTAWFHGDNYEALFVGYKIYHALLVGLLYAVFFLVASFFLKRNGYAVLATICLFSFSEIFSTRSFFPRPHLINIALVLLAYLFVIRRNVWGLLVVNILSPLSYSVSFFTVVPGVVSTLSRRWKYLLVSVAGLALGIVLHPHPLNYVFNGYYLHIRSIFHSIFVVHVGPAELFAGQMSVFTEPWLFLYGIVLAYAAVSFFARKEAWTKVWTLEEVQTLGTSFVFYVPFMLVQRTAEYVVPFSILIIFSLWIRHALPFIKSCAAQYSIPVGMPVFEVLIRYTSREIIARLYGFRRLVRILFGIFVVGMFVVCLGQQIVFLRAQADPLVFKELTDYLVAHSEPQDVVFYREFSLYTRLVFFDQKNSYPFGMDPIFTYVDNPEVYWAWFHLFSNDDTCVTQVCMPENRVDIPTAMKNIFHTRYVVVDDSSELSVGNISKDGELFERYLESSTHFKKVFTTSDGVFKLYELVTN